MSLKFECRLRHNMATQSLSVLKPEDAGRPSAVLVDGLSIRICANFEQWRRGRGTWQPRLMEKDDSTYSVPPAFALIQSMVIYENVLVDSFILKGKYSAPCRAFCRRFPSIFQVVDVPTPTREELVELLKQYVQTDSFFDKHRNRTVSRQDVSFVRKIREFTVRMHDSDAERFFQPFEHGKLGSGEWSVFRAHFYLELARHLGAFLSPHELRAQYYQQVVERNGLSKLKQKTQGLPEKIVNEVDKEIRRKNAKYLEPLCVDIPPVTDWVMRIASTRKMDYKKAIMVARNSKNAVRFRKWCAEMTEMTLQGRAGLRAAQRIRRELEKASAAWCEDLDEDVRYKTRKINLCKLPLIGGVLTTLGVEEAEQELHDPVLAPTRPYLLLLNDLYR